MPATPTTKWQVSGYRFLVRRMEHALVRRDVRMLHDPMRSQSRALAVGAVLASLGLAACAVLALIRPQDKIADNKIVVGKDSGAMFVVLGDTLHPVMNLASARLAVDDPAKPAIVKESELGKRPRGPLVGIPGAPSALPFGKGGSGQVWTVCDAIDADGTRSITSSVLVGDPKLGDSVSGLGSGEALLLSADDGTYLVYNGKRAKIDLTNRAVTSALALEGATPRPVSRGLINAIPEVPAIAAPKIDGAGGTPSYPMPGQKIGSVVAVPRGADTQYYVVLKDGIQAVSSATADLIRFTDSQGAAEMSKVTPDALTKAPPVERLAVSTFPQTVPSVVTSRDKPVSCLSWKPVGTAQDKAQSGVGAEVTVLSGRGLPIAPDAKMVELAQADGPGANADTVYLRPGTGAFVQTTGIEPTSQRKDSLFYISDAGVRFGVTDVAAAKALGFSTAPEPAPWAIVDLLAPGPALGREGALIAHDGVAPDASPAALPVAESSGR